MKLTHKKLSAPQNYERVSADPWLIINKLLSDITQYLISIKKLFSDKTYKFLLPVPNPRIPIFYLLPKMYKPNVPGRRIISGCSSPTDHLSAFVDFYLKPITLTFPSYIKDNNHFLRLVL